MKAIDTALALRSVLNSNQAARERLCLGLMQIDGRFSGVRPRQPEGGPDKGRDLEALREGVLCYGAVAFKNDASDTTEEIREIFDKFEADLTAALAANANLRAFAFFTNLRLTVGQQADLESQATDAGIVHCDVFDRERMRGMLDGPRGLFLRFQYLGVTMSDEEQKQFFQQFGRDLELSVNSQFGALSSRVDRLAFDMWRSQPLRSLDLYVTFTNPISAVELSHFRILLVLESDVYSKRDIYLGGRDHHLRRDSSFQFGSRSVFGTELFNREDRLEFVPQNVHVYGGCHRVRELHFAVEWQLYQRLPAKEIKAHWSADILHGLHPRIHFTGNLTGKIARVSLVALPYTILDCDISDAVARPINPVLPWIKGDLNSEEESLTWWGIVPLPAQQIDFDADTPALRRADYPG